MKLGDLYLDRSDDCLLMYVGSHYDVFFHEWHVFIDTKGGRWEYDSVNLEYLEIIDGNK